MANPIGLAACAAQPPGPLQADHGRELQPPLPGPDRGRGRGCRITSAPTRRQRQLLRTALRQAIEAAPVETELQSLRRTLLQLSCDADIVLDLHCDAEAVVHLYTETPCAEACDPLARFLRSSPCSPWTRATTSFDEACSQVWWKWKARFGERFPIPQACLSVTVELRAPPT